MSIVRVGHHDTPRLARAILNHDLYRDTKAMRTAMMARDNSDANDDDNDDGRYW